MENRIEVTVKLGDKEISLSGPEPFVRAEVERLTNAIAAKSSSLPHLSTRPDVKPIAEGLPASEREFVATKKPAGHSQTVAVLAYYLTRSGQSEFTPDDIRRSYARAGVRPPKVVGQALRDAKNVYDFLEPGAKKGSYRLSAHGERTVEFDMPKESAK